MTTRDEIIDLVRKCAKPDGDFGIDNAIAFSHAAQRQVYERAAEVCMKKWKREDSFDAYTCSKAILALIEGDEK